MPRIQPRTAPAAPIVLPKAAPKATTAQPTRATASGFDATRRTPQTDTNLKHLAELLKGHTDRNEEKQILALFKGASADDLNAMVAQMPQHELHEKVSDMNNRLFGPDNRTAFLTLMSNDRLEDLSVENRAKVISTLQYHRTDSLDEKAVRDIFLGTRGKDLSELKKAIDHGGDHRDLQQLIFHDIDDENIRAQVLAHFKAEGVAAPSGRVKVLSDIDDTFYANLKDNRYPSKTVYPGVKDFYAELDKGGAATADAGGDLMFLSARPYDRLGASEHLTHDTLEKAGVHDATVLSGDFAHLIGNQSIADKKFENWEQVRQLHPEYGSVFVGDSGQGDAIFGSRAAAMPGTDMKKVFIHNVTGLDDAQRKDFASKGVFIFDTYVGAATEAFKSGLISKEGLQRVAAGAQRELASVPFTKPEQKAAREQDLARDLDAMRLALQ